MSAADPDPWRNSLRDQFGRPLGEALPVFAHGLPRPGSWKSSLARACCCWRNYSTRLAIGRKQIRLKQVAVRRFPRNFWRFCAMANVPMGGHSPMIQPEPPTQRPKRWRCGQVAALPTSCSETCSLPNIESITRSQSTGKRSVSSGISPRLMKNWATHSATRDISMTRSQPCDLDSAESQCRGRCTPPRPEFDGAGGLR